MNARTGSLPWDLSGRTKTLEETKAWLEKLAREQAKEPIKPVKETQA